MSERERSSRQRPLRCCIVGGGPAGMVLGFLLARAGVEVAVLEKHADFFRDFRGDTIHPSTLELLHELGLLDAFLQRPHEEVRQLSAQIGATTLTLADFSKLPTTSKFIALMPQWDFLNFFALEAQRYPGFRLMTQTEATEIIVENDTVVGVHIATPEGTRELRADLIVGADGRHSTIRRKASLDVLEIGAPIDVLWLRLSRYSDDPAQIFGRVNFGKLLVTLNRGEYWQCAYVIRKDGYARVRQRGLDAFREDIAALAPFLRERVGELRSWDDIKLLTVKVDRLRRWFRPGLLCIGDAAHAMSPIGGVGINLAIQDAVAAANILAETLRDGSVSTASLHRVQRRRELPTRLTQRLQVLIQNRVIDRVLENDRVASPPLLLHWLSRFPIARAIPARVVGIGFRAEHVRTPDASSESGRDVAGVVAPPPLLYAGALAVSLLIERKLSHSRLPAAAGYAGASLAVAAFAIGPPALKTMRAAGTNVNPFQPSSALVETGPFAYTRNPLYVSMTLLYAAIALGARATFPLAVLPAVLWFVNAGVIEREERYLERLFPQTYARYKARVRRWI